MTTEWNLTMKTRHFEDVMEEALNAFWAVIANRFPEADSGDLSPGAVIALTMAAEDAVKEWIANNVPPQLNPN